MSIKSPLIRWRYKHKLWEKLETAAFSPKLLQFGWPPGPIWKGFFLKWSPKGHSPQSIRGGGGSGGGNERVGSSLGALFVYFFYAFWNAMFKPSYVTLEHFGTLFASIWGVFLGFKTPHIALTGGDFYWKTSGKSLVFEIQTFPVWK